MMMNTPRPGRDTEDATTLKRELLVSSRGEATTLGVAEAIVCEGINNI